MATIRDVRRYLNRLSSAVRSPRVRSWVADKADGLFDILDADNSCAPESQEFGVLSLETSLSLKAEELLFEIRIIGSRIRWASLSPLNMRGAEVGDEIVDILFVVEELEVGEEIRLAGKRWPVVAALARFDNLGLLVTKGKGEILIQKLDPTDFIGGSI